MKKTKKLHVFSYISLIIYAAISLYPMIWMVFYSLKDNEEIFVTNPFGIPKVFRFENYQKAASEFDMLLLFKNSIFVSLMAMFLGIIFSLMFTYVLARIRNKWTRSLRTVVLLGMFVPIQAVMTPLVIMVRGMGLTNTLWSLIIPYTALSFPFAVMILYGFFIAIPIDFEESAFIEGAGFFKSFFFIILPQMKSAIMVLVIYQFMAHWNEFSLALVLITKPKFKTLPLGLAGFFGMFSTDWGPVGAALVMASLPVMIMYIFFSSKVNDSMTLSGIKG